MSKLEKNLKEWVSRGFISKSQADRICEHESSKPENAWIFSGFLILGVLIVGIGLVSLIAANWTQIPDVVKLTADFLILFLIASLTYLAWKNKKTVLFEVSLLFFLVFCLASIGLISQVFHTSGEIYEALMLWSCITFATTLATRQMFVPLFWGIGFLAALSGTLFNALLLQPIFNKNYVAVVAFIPLLCGLITFASQKFAGEVGYTRAFRFLTLTTGLLALCYSQFRYIFWQNPIGMYAQVRSFAPTYILTVWLAIIILWSPEYLKFQRTLLRLTMAIYLLVFQLPLIGIKSELAYAACALLVLALLAVFFASQKNRVLFQSFLVLIGLRIFILYFQALGGLARTGVGFIVAGLLLLGMLFLWHKYRQTLTAWLERILS